MKYVSYILATLGVILLLNIFLSYSSDSYRLFLKDSKIKMIWVSKEDQLEKMNKDQSLINEKILDSIDKLNENLDDLKKKTEEKEIKPNIDQTFETGSMSSTWDTNTWTENIETKKDSELPWMLITKLMPEINPLRIENEWLFSLTEKDLNNKIEYTTYFDSKSNIKVYLFDLPYDSLLKEFKWMKKYWTNETWTFFSYTFFLNPVKKDPMVRLITMLEWKTVWFETDKTWYSLLKKSLQE